MAERYIAPEEVSAALAAIVLDFLNSAQSAQEIAERVELADELDVGLRLGQRILDRRAQLGGFTTLQQVADVPLIGPERFTEIVVTLTGMRPRDPIEDELDRLRDEVRALREAIGGLGGPTVRVSIRSVIPRAYLGQVVTLLVEAREALGDRPVVGLPVTLVATSGEFHTPLGTTIDRERSIVVQTGVDGRVRVRLFPSTREPLLDDHQAALEDALRGLDPEAVAPRDARAGLEEIVRRYRSPQGVRLREAIDMVVEEAGGAARDPVLPQDALDEWPTFDATVLALAQTGGASAVSAMAALTLRFRNWMPAWLEVFEEAARAGADVDGRLSGLGGDTTAPPEFLLTAALGRVRGYVEQERGRVGSRLARVVADDSMRRFLDEGITRLPVETRVSLREGLGAARATLRSQGSVGLLALEKGQETLRSTIAPVTEGLRGAVNEATTAVANLSGQVAELRSDVGGVRGSVTDLDQRVGQFDTRILDLDRRIGEIDPRILALDAQLLEMDQRVTTVDTRIRDMDTRLLAFDTQLATLDSGIESFDGRIADLDARLATFDTRVTQMGTQLGTVSTRVNQLGTQVGTVDSRVTELGTRLTAVDTRVASVDTRVTAVDSRVTGVNSEVTRLNGRVTDIGRRL